MFGIYTLLVLFVLLPLSFSAGNKVKLDLPLNKFQQRLFLNKDIAQTTLGKHYMPAWWAFWGLMVVIAIISGYWGSVAVFGLYVWSRIRFMNLIARPHLAVGEKVSF